MNKFSNNAKNSKLYRSNYSLILVDKIGISKVKRIINTLKEKYIENAIFLLDPELKLEKVEKFFDKVLTKNDIMTPNLVKRIEDRAFDLSYNWFKNEYGKDIFEMDGISLGMISQLEMYEYFKEILTYIEVFRYFKNKKEHYDFYIVCPKIFYLKELFEDESFKNYKLYLINKWNIEYKFKKLLSFLKKKTFIEFIKNNFLDWQLKYFISLFYSFWRKKRKLNSTDNLFIYDVHNKPMIKTLSKIYERLFLNGHNVFGISFEPRIYNLIPKMGQKSFLSQYGSIESYINSRKKWRLIFKNYLKNLESIKRNFVYDGINFFNLCKDKLEKLIKRYYKQLFFEYEIIISNFLQQNPKNIILASDSHKMSRLFVLIAKRRKIPTTVIQHGALCGKFAYVPVLADKIAIWGNYPKKWFMMHGVPEEKLFITGQPRYDDLYNRKIELKKKWQNKRNLKDKYKFLLATNPIGKELNTELIKIVAQGFPKSQDYKLIIKLHPGKSDYEFFNNAIKKLNFSNACITREEDLYLLLFHSDAVITSNSTVGIEALILEKPLIIISLKNLEAQIPYEEYKCALIVKDAEELKKAIKVVMTDANLRAKLKDNSKKFLEDYLYKINGKSTERVLSLLNF